MKSISTFAKIINKYKLEIIENKLETSKNKFNHFLIKQHLQELLNNEFSFSDISSNENLKILLEYENKNTMIDYDIRVIIGEKDDEEKIAEKIFFNLNTDEEYVSTRGMQDNFLFYDVIRDGLAKDNGLYVPKYFPVFDSGQWQILVNMNYQQRCLRILESFSIGKLKPKILEDFINKSYATFIHDDILKVKQLEDNIFLMEEFYGPSASFKDLALQLFPKIFQESIKDNKYKTCILVATSGDTGSAVLEGFKESEVPVIVLYPVGKVSQIQEAQMITAEGNVYVIGVKGDFDFCQTTVKEIFNDTSFTDRLKNEFNITLTSANSINWGRLLPQVVYSAHSYLELVRQKNINFGDPVDVCIPSGNFGNILGAFIAKRMGLPLDKLICASNEVKIFN
jgi:threonine synthase